MQMIHIGTSGFYYDHWIGKCYPEDISKHDLLPFFAQHFKTVEINSTFYHLPRRTTIERWLEATPDDFLFTLKANRSITHNNRLDTVHEEITVFIRLIKPLKEKLGVILLQLPPHLKLDIKLLDAFITELPKGYRYAIEFRDESWMDDLVFELMALHGIALCINDYAQRQTPWIATAPFVYIRMHGPMGRYRGKYDSQKLTALCNAIKGFVNEGREVFCYFNNDMEGFAWQNAQELRELCGGDR
jgi:uncharacterized protein YecE (DUF72 family)